MSAKRLSVVLHDVAPCTWQACRHLLEGIDRLGLPVTLLVVPDYHHRGKLADDPAFCAAIETRLRQGDEIALHGYSHLDDVPGTSLRRRVYTAGEGEFAVLEQAAAAERLGAGLAQLESLGWPAAGFVAPAWLMSSGSRAAIADAGFAYTTSLGAVWRLPQWERLPAPCLNLSSRSGWRRRVSRWVTVAGNNLLSAAGTVRVGFHPADALYSPQAEHLFELTAKLAISRQAVVKSELLESALRTAA